MLDVIAIFSFIVLFPLSVFYVHGCNWLKGVTK
jgi:hypothetical protein